MRFHSYDEMIKTVFNYNRGKVKFTVTEKEVSNEIAKLIDDKIPDFQLVNGHDFAFVFALALRSKIASLAAKAAQPDEVEAGLIFAYDSAHFKNSSLFGLLKQWEESQAVTVFSI